MDATTPLDQAKAIVKKTVDAISGDIEVAPTVTTFLSTTFADYLTLLKLTTTTRVTQDSPSAGPVPGPCAGAGLH